MLPVPAVHPALLALAVVAVAVGPLDDAGRPVALVVAGLGLARQRGQGHHDQGAQQRQRALHFLFWIFFGTCFSDTEQSGSGVGEFSPCLWDAFAASFCSRVKLSFFLVLHFGVAYDKAYVPTRARAYQKIRRMCLKKSRKYKRIFLMLLETYSCFTRNV